MNYSYCISIKTRTNTTAFHGRKLATRLLVVKSQYLLEHLLNNSDARFGVGCLNLGFRYRGAWDQN